MFSESETKFNIVFNAVKDNYGIPSNFIRKGTENTSSLDYEYLTVISQKETELLKKSFNKKSEYVLIQAENTPAAIIMILASWSSGYIPVLISPFSTKEEKSSYKKQLPKGTKLYNKLLVSSSEKISPKSKSEPKNTALSPEKEALVIFTSGSTGNPKGVIHTFSSLIAAAKMQNKHTRTTSKSIWLQSLPLYHIGGFMIFFRSLVSGSTMYLTEKSDAGSIAESLAIAKITHLSLVPAQCNKLLEDAGAFSSVKCLLLGGGPIGSGLIKLLRKRNIPTHIVYGSSETAGFCSSLMAKEINTPAKLGVKPLNEVQVRITNNDLEELMGLKQGQILIASPSLFKGYLSKEDEVFHILHRKKYYITSDVGYIDRAGLLHITKRADSVIITGGKKVSVSEVENCLKAFGTILDAKVFAVSDTYWGEMVCAALVVSIPKSFPLDELITTLKMKLSSYKVPKEWVLLETLPRTALGKINTSALVEMTRVR